ncbi:hypothetical protein NDA11_001911 [Ustilago hordei]|nr:hypothetical protein NDA11_001911 [Ustilago hordei]KAJ1599895.1 hypothetical protein NDA14_004684 [Ustilago hordei]UTT92579.1 hypothetical protein NDA17_002492 [Ustilago hordei]
METKLPATYTGVSLWALSLAGYLPSNTTFAKAAGDTITKIWTKTAHLWQSELNSLGGPWDRTYGIGLSGCVSLLGYSVAGLFDADVRSWPVPWKLSGASHVDDAAFAPLMAITSKYHDKSVSQESRNLLKPNKTGNRYGRLVKSHAWSPPFDANVKQYGPRNYTAWITPNISVGRTEIDEAVIGGPAKNPTAFTPAAFAANYTAPTQMTLMFGISPLAWLPDDFLLASNRTEGKLPGMELELNGSVASGAVKRSLTYDSEKNVYGFYYYNLTFALGGLAQNTVPQLVVSYKLS